MQLWPHSIKANTFAGFRFLLSKLTLVVSLFARLISSLATLFADWNNATGLPCHSLSVALCGSRRSWLQVVSAGYYLIIYKRVSLFAAARELRIQRANEWVSERHYGFDFQVKENSAITRRDEWSFEPWLTCPDCGERYLSNQGKFKKSRASKIDTFPEKVLHSNSEKESWSHWRPGLRNMTKLCNNRHCRRAIKWHPGINVSQWVSGGQSFGGYLNSCTARSFTVICMNHMTRDWSYCSNLSLHYKLCS